MKVRLKIFNFILNLMWNYWKNLIKETILFDFYFIIILVVVSRLDWFKSRR